MPDRAPCAQRGSLHSSVLEAHKKNFSRSLCAEVPNVLSCFAEANHLSRGRFIEAALTQPPFEEGASMRKQNHSIPPVLRHNSGLNNSAIRSRKCKRPNALKHGFYSVAPLIPGEDPREFQEILAELMDEWKPSGPTLPHAVLEPPAWRFNHR